jgi:hypothetical protein
MIKSARRVDGRLRLSNIESHSVVAIFSLIRNERNEAIEFNLRCDKLPSD